jgi:GrpB-like predicted nucleotidyltransferase (UPF0157 family)
MSPRRARHHDNTSPHELAALLLSRVRLEERGLAHAQIWPDIHDRLTTRFDLNSKSYNQPHQFDAVTSKICSSQPALFRIPVRPPWRRSPKPYLTGGLRMDEVEIVAYDPRWPAMFAEEALLLRRALDDGLVVGVEHFGSTAIPGMAAKPIIDILVAVRSLAAARTTVIDPLQRLGYVFWAENPKTDRMFFVKGMPPYGARRTHHVHITEPAGEPWSNLLFRDYLRAHPDEASL